MLLWTFFVFLCFFHREIIFEVLIWATRAKASDVGLASIRLKAELKRAPSLFIMDQPIIEAAVVETFFKRTLWVSADLWNSLTESERESLLVWAHSAIERRSLVLRLLGFFDPKTADRDCLLLARDPLALSTSLEKMHQARATRPPTHLGTLIAGLSMLGPPLLHEGIDSKARMNAYVEQLTRLRK